MNRHTHRGQKRGARKTKAEDVTHTLPTHYGRCDGRRERSDGARPTQFERDRTAEVQGLVITATCRSRPLSPTGGVPRPRQPRLCYRRWRLDWARARRVPRRGAGGLYRHELPAGALRRATVGLQLVESSTAGPKRLPLPCRSPPVVRARRPPRKRNSPKECRRRACPCKSSTGLEEYPPRARFLRLRRSIGR